MYGELRFTISPFDEFAEGFDNSSQNVFFKVKGNDQQIKTFIDKCRSVTDIYGLHANMYDYPGQCVTTLNTVWVMIVVFLFLTSFFYASVAKREKAISICYGRSRTAVVMRAMAAELAVLVPLTMVCAFAVGSVLLMKMGRNEILYMLALIAVSVVPYIMYASFHIQMISFENRQLVRAARLSKLFKIVLTAMTILSLVLSYYSFSSLLKLYYNNASLSEFKGCSLLRITMTDHSAVPEEIRSFNDAVAQSYADRIVSNELYKKFYDSNNITEILPVCGQDEQGAYDIIYCNSHARQYLANYVHLEPEALTENSILYFIPGDPQAAEERIRRMDNLLWNMNHSELPQAKAMEYRSEIEFNYFSDDEEGLIGHSQSPYIIFDSTDPAHNPVDLLEDRRDMIRMIVQPDEAIVKELDGINGLEYHLYPIEDSVQYAISRSKKAILSLGMIDLLLLILAVVMTSHIISFDYKLNGKEYCIKTTLGYTRLKKYRRIFLFLLLVHIAIPAAAALKFPQYGLSVFAVSAVLCCIDLMTAGYFTVREKKRKRSLF